MSDTKAHPMAGVDSFTPAMVARMVAERGVVKAKRPS